MDLVVKKVQGDDNIIDYTTGYTAGSLQATTDFKLGEKEKKNLKQKTEYSRGFNDGYHHTYEKCQEKSLEKEDSLTKMLRQRVII